MIRTRLFFIRRYRIHKDTSPTSSTSEPAADFIYCIYVMGFLIHAVPIYGISKMAAQNMFPKNRIEEV